MFCDAFEWLIQLKLLSSVVPLNDLFSVHQIHHRLVLANHILYDVNHPLRYQDHTFFRLLVTDARTWAVRNHLFTAPGFVLKPKVLVFLFSLCSSAISVHTILNQFSDRFTE